MAHLGQGVAVAMRAGNVVQPGVGGGAAQYGDLSSTSKQEQLRHAALLKRVDAERRARKIVVPTNDAEVRAVLRKLGHPVRLFGESVADVRERLRETLARIEIEGEEREHVAALLALPDPLAPGDAKEGGAQGESRLALRQAQAEARGDVYAPASAELVAARRKIAAWSFPRASERLEAAKRRRDVAEARGEGEAQTMAMYGALGRLALAQSQVGDARPLGRVRASADGSLVATASWSGSAKVWDVESCGAVATIAGHANGDRVTGLAWIPHRDRRLVLTGGADGIAMLWDCASSSSSTTEGGDGDAAMDEGSAALPPLAAEVPAARLVRTFAGHSERLGHVDVHPQGCYAATTSYDHTWRLWDLETGAELLLQDGHAAETYACAFQGDGALIATGDFHGICHIWDTRSGKLAWSALGHGKKILCAAWSPEGHLLATGSDDHTTRIWDLRRKTCAYTLPAHSSLVSDVRWSPTTGEALATSGFDGKIKLWSTRDWSSLTSLAAHDGKAMSVDFVDDNRVVSAGFDRTFKLWEPHSVDLAGYE